ncbi:hypothetical protein G6O69_28595 [Pseudenhygromyxa sp. WMMC2535]|uniref:hypothetical protein n=1 Tax=Pseudenhygromyxa sp. WMMC2535 TaxID=2712867 RepID=UPI0015555007|nr:hypothetical protein [Pseudenhygromyxa sp. WMMC2535]NVB41826.1 hypothetical protein [Pseudenhygromyxa sp. WMMC2535]
MASTPTSLALQRSYRHLDPAQVDAARHHLHNADDALNMALLTLDGSEDEHREAKQARAATARRLLAEAVTSLARARVFVPGVRTYTVSVVTTGEREIDRELLRLHELATTLLWHNHSVLPAQRQAQPLTPEDEAQLAAVVGNLNAQARLDRAMRFKWLVGAALCSVLAPALGFGLFLLALASAIMAGVELARGAAPPVLPA